MSNAFAIIENKSEIILAERQEAINHVCEAFGMWSMIDDMRDRILLKGRDLVIGLIYARIGNEEANKTQICKSVSEFIGGRCFHIVSQILDEFEGTDPLRHLWYKTPSDTYRVISIMG